jgi:LysM repeat protein
MVALRRAGLTKQQAVALLTINAIVSIIISLTVVMIFDRYRGGVPAAATATPGSGTALAVASLPSATATPGTSEVRAVATYVVKAGDSLSSIAFRYQVPLDALMKANGIDNANYITVGESLLIPEGGVVPESSPTPKQAPTLAPVLTPEGAAVPVVIESVTTAEKADGEYVTISNKGSKGVGLEGWTLEDGHGHAFTFPNLFLWRSGTVLVHTGQGTDSATDLYWGLADPVWQQGAKATLRDADGKVVSELVVGSSASGG